MKTCTLVYIHGFMKTGESEKAMETAAQLKDCEVLSPVIPFSPDEAIAALTALFDLLREKKERVYVVGSSLGGWYALYVSALYDLPVFLLNPSLTPWNTLSGKMPDEYLERFRDLSGTIESRCTDSLINAFLANDDEVLNHTAFTEKFPGARTVLRFDNAGHRFSRYAECVIPEIDRIIREDAAVR